MSIPVIIDCDPGIDDAVAILLALASPELNVRAITTVSGNATIERTTTNARSILKLVGRTDIPVGGGASRPLVRVAEAPTGRVHGEDGMGDVGLPDVLRWADTRTAIELITDVVESSEEPVTLIAIGPLTNLALLDAVRPDVMDRLGNVVIMGGAARGGNRRPTAEFNIWYDPEAAKRVFALGLEPTMIGLDVTEKAVTRAEMWAPLRDGGHAAETVLAMNEYYANYHVLEHGEAYTMQHDALAVAAVIDPDIISTVHAHVDVECASPLTQGTTVADIRQKTGLRPNTHVAVEVDVDAFNTLLIERISTFLNGISLDAAKASG